MEILYQKVPNIPCQAHRVNIFIERECETSLIVADIFSDVQKPLYIFFI